MSSSQREYSYDDADRLTAVVSKNPASGANESKTEFVYDGMSRLRVSREYSWAGGAWVVTPNSEKRRIYDGMDVVQERDASNTVLTTYTRDGNIGGILAKSSADGNFYFHYDGSGNVVGLSDANQNSVASYDYDAYGNIVSSSGAQASENAYRYSTKEYFGSVGLYNYGFRFYSPGLGRWINRDPIGESGGLNLYGFNHNSSINYVDAYGLFIEGVGTLPVLSPSIAADIAAVEGGAAAATAGPIAVAVVGIPAAAYVANVYVGQPLANALYPDDPGDTGYGGPLAPPVQGPPAPGAPPSGAPSGTRPGKDFSRRGKKKVIDDNRKKNGGVTRCEECGVETIPSEKSKSGITPPCNETQVDHIFPKSKGGSGSPDNGQVLCRKCNRQKSNR